jgi:hypothetical protein
MTDFDGCDRIRGLAERSDVLHVGIQFPLCNEGSHDIEDAAGPVPFDYVSAQLSDGGITGADQLAAVGDQTRHRPKALAPSQIEDRVDAVGKDLFDPQIHPSAAGRQGGTKGLHQRALVLARGPNNVDAEISGDLGSSDSHPTADAIDEERLTFLQVELSDAVIGGGGRDGERRAESWNPGS